MEEAVKIKEMYMPKVLFLGDIHQDGHRLFEKRAGFERILFEDPKPSDLHDVIADIDAIVLRKLDLKTDVLRRATALKVVSRHGVGCDNVDVEALTSRGIPVMTVGSANAVSVAEHAMMLMLATARRLPACTALVRQSGDDDRRRFLRSRDEVGTMELADRTVLVLGFGRIGRRVARLSHAFDMDVVVADPYVGAPEVEAVGFRHVDHFENALGDADCVVLCVPATATGQPLFKAAEFAAMKPGAIFINIARGSLVDERDLADAVGRGHLLGAGTDVWQRLPPGPENPLVSTADIVTTPHCAAHTRACLSRMATTTIQNVFDFFDGTLKRELCFNPEAVDWPARSETIIRKHRRSR